MKVFVLLTPGFPKDESDTTCLPAFQQFALSIQGQYKDIKLIVLTLQYPYESKSYFWNGIPCISIGGKNKPGIGRVYTWLRAFVQLTKINRQHKIDWILSLWLNEASFVGKYSSKFLTCKHLMWLIGQDAKSDNQYIKRIKPKGNEIIAMSDYLRESYYANHGVYPFSVVENGINKKLFPELNKNKRDIAILGVGSLIPLKNYNLFIEIIHHIKQTQPHIKACIAGTGIEEQQLKDRVKSLGLEENITFLGLVPHVEIFEYMNRSRIFLHTSNYEGNSTVLMEALYSGCYTISTQPLSNQNVKKLHIASNKARIVELIQNHLMDTEYKAERICFNTMDDSAKKIVNLFTANASN